MLRVKVSNEHDMPSTVFPDIRTECMGRFDGQYNGFIKHFQKRFFANPSGVYVRRKTDKLCNFFQGGYDADDDCG